VSHIWVHSKGSRSGRIAPTDWTPPDGSWVFTLGLDNFDTSFVFGENDFSIIRQDMDLDGINFVRVQLRFKSRQVMPSSKVVTGVAADTLDPGEAFTAVNVLYMTSGQFDESDTSRLVTVSGSSSGNDGTYRTVAKLPPVAAMTGYDRVLLREDLNATEGTVLTATMKALKWRVTIEIDGGVEASMDVDTDRVRDRNDMAANVSKLTSVHEVAFRLRLIEV